MKQKAKSTSKTKSASKKNKVLLKTNPFDLKFNKAKYAILGKKKNGPDGFPVQTKKKSLEEREKHLGTQYKSVSKVNKILDKRIGEKSALSQDEKASKRFAEEKKNKNKFNLSEETEDVLTHGGEALTAVERYGRVEGSDDDDDEVETADFHFGGNETGGKKSRLDIVAEVIARSKGKRLEKCTEREEQEAAAASLDEKLKAIVMKGALTQNTTKQKEKTTRDDYDAVLMGMKMSNDKKASAIIEKKKKEDEVETFVEKNTENTHYSADDDGARKGGERKERRTVELKFDDDGKAIRPTKNDRAVMKRLRMEESEEDEDDDDLEDDGEDLDQLMEEEEDDDPSSECAAMSGARAFAPSYAIPSSYAAFSASIASLHATRIEEELQTLISRNAPNLKEGNKEELRKVVLWTVRQMNEWSGEGREERLHSLLPPLHRLLTLDREEFVRCVRAWMRSEWRDISPLAPSFSLPTLIRLVARLFPVHQVWHPVCTPALLLATQCLVSVRISSLSVLARQLFLASSLTAYIEYSRRLVPELVTFVQGALGLAVSSPSPSPSTLSTVFPPPDSPHSSLLLIRTKPKGTLRAVSVSEAFGGSAGLSASDVNRCRVLRVIVALTHKLALIYSDLPTFHCIFSDVQCLLAALDVNVLPSELCEELSSLQSYLHQQLSSSKMLTQLSKPRNDNNMLRMLEPRIEESFDAEKKETWKKSRLNDKSKMRGVLRREKRGAVKEVRRDTAFISRSRALHASRLDGERKRKTKRLVAALQGQEGEARARNSKAKWAKR